MKSNRSSKHQHSDDAFYDENDKSWRKQGKAQNRKPWQESRRAKREVASLGTDSR